MKPMPSTPSQHVRSHRPGRSAARVGRSICVTSPVITAFESKPRRVRNIFICSRRRVLRFVEDHERVVQRAAAHERERRHLDHAALDQALRLLEVHHVVQRVVERTQIRVHLLREVAGQEAELLARLDRGAREDHARDLLPIQRGDRHRHREIRLARAGRPDREHDVVRCDQLDVAALREVLRGDAAPRADVRRARRRRPRAARCRAASRRLGSRRARRSARRAGPRVTSRRAARAPCARPARDPRRPSSRT